MGECLPPGCRLLTYRCDGKPRVYEAFGQITARYPDIRSVLFFVDKDLDDVLGVPWPTDPRVFVTDVYSVENFLVCREVLVRFYQDAIRLTGVEFGTAALLERFDRQLLRFHRMAIPLVAWIVVARRAGLRPNLGNIELQRLFGLSEDCDVGIRPCKRVAYLAGATGVSMTAGLFRRVSQTCREVRRIPAKRVVRGKFEAWFFVEFWKKLTKQLQTLSREANATLTVKIGLEQSNLVPTLVGHATIPRSLELFLGLHFPRGGPAASQVRAHEGRAGRLLARCVAAARRVLGS